MPRPAGPAAWSDRASACARASGGRGATSKRRASRSQPMLAMTSPMAIALALLGNAEDIEHPTLACHTGQVFHCVDEPARGGAVARIEVVRYDETGPSTHARKHRDVLAAVAAAVRDRLPDDARDGLVLPELAPVLRVDRLEPAVHRSVEHEVAAGGERAAPHREGLRDRPHLLARDRIPRHEATARLVEVLVHLGFGAEVGRARDVTRRKEGRVLAQVLMRHIEQSRARRPRTRLPVLGARRAGTVVANNASQDRR